MNRCTNLAVISALFFANSLCLTSLSAQDNYPVPEKTEKMLFYFQRSHNKNTVVYEVNTLPSGLIDSEKPVNYYWIRFEEGGVRKELSFLQRKAFGLEWQSTDKKKESFILHFKSFKKRDIFLIKSDGREAYKAYMEINGELSELNRMFIKSENNSMGIPLSVKYIEMTGLNLKSKKRVTERYIPKQ
jgi:hypothetical protein